MKQIEINKTSKQLRYIVILALSVFLNFTLTVQYMNWSSYDISITEIAEEEEEEIEAENELLAHLLSDVLFVNQVSFKIEDEYFEPRLIGDVQTPPPKFS